MKKVYLTSLIILLTGCKSLSDIRNEQPNNVFSSAKGVDEVAECILYGWQSKSYIDGPMKAYIQPLPNGKTVYTDNFIEVADIEKIDDLNLIIKFYSQGRLHRDEMRAVISKCI
ncbi:hypothetical protein RIN58_07225 [Siccibacter colletis]|uniref:hypothetical protein n=1 Tax=Siccibacter colletis TaxID=1505757 RepID=UPI0028BDD66E|nr:hypothetical protein [Siccibacter colletis]WNN49883.1 hypothetical protein RIN58_07225 [Siccibacter colletis]